MRNKIIYSLFVFLLVFHSLASEETFTDRVYAVHATRILPQEGTLKTGDRWTVHFALGELVQPLDDGTSWEDCPFAVITPLKTLLPQLLNLNCYDTFVLGDVILPEESVIVIPEETEDFPLLRGRIVTYSPSKESLRDAVKKVIEASKGWHFKMRPYHSESEMGLAFLNGKNVNKRNYFANILEDHPHVSFGLRYDPYDGEHYRLGLIEKILLSGDDFEQLEEHFQKWKASISTFQMPETSASGYEAIGQRLELSLEAPFE